jgi:tetratricopeptide (TPR) repeat protein
MHRLTVKACAILLFCALPSAAAAQREITPAEMETEARARFELGRVHMEQGRFADAAQEFEAAHRLSGRPELLYNVFVARRDGGQIVEAATALREYLRLMPEPMQGRAQLTARLEALDQQIAAGQTGSEGGGSEASPVPWILVGVGGAIGIAAAITGGLALEMHSALEARCPGGVCGAEDQDDIDTGRSLAIATEVLWPTAVVAFAIGLIWGIVDLAGGSSESTAFSCNFSGCEGRF